MLRALLWPFASFLLWPAFGQEPSVPAKPIGLPERQPGFARDFDIRDSPTSDDLSAQTSPNRTLREWLAVQKTSLRDRVQARGRTRVPRFTTNAHGLVKTLWIDGAPLSDSGDSDAESASRTALRQYGEWLSLPYRGVDSMRLLSRISSSGIEVLSFEQTVRGIGVFQGILKVALNTRRQVVHLSAGDLLALPDASPGQGAVLTAEQAVKAAYATLSLQIPATLEPAESPDSSLHLFRNPALGANDISAVETIFPLSPIAGIAAWRILLDAGPQASYEIVVSGQDGRLLFRHNLYRSAGQARVWKESPMRGERELITLPDTWLPAGQTTSTNNNADVYLDVDGNNLPDSSVPNDLRLRNGRAFSATQEFDFPAGEGTTARNPREFQAAALTNAFYFVNLAHDYFYELGFTEQAGNFQKDNFGRGGKSGDPVLVEVQDRLSADNASFLTLPDGSPGRMELGLFLRKSTSLTDDLDSGYDGTIIFHEYAHGVTSRLVGGGTQASCLRGHQSGAMGEGWSDYFAMSYFDSPVFGAYASQNRFSGIRRQSYDNNRLSYESLGYNDYEVHDDGEIWGAVLWDIRKALGKSTTDRLVMQALKLTPCNSGMVEARDAILKTDELLNGGTNREALWRVFATRGLGSSASGLDGTISRGTVYNAAYDLPPDLLAGNRVPEVKMEPAPTVQYQQSLAYRVSASDPDGDALRYELLDGPPGMTLDPETGELRWEAEFVGKPVRIGISDRRGGHIVHAFNLLVEAPLGIGQSLTVAGPENSTGLVRIPVGEGIEVLEVQLKDGTGDADLILVDPNSVLYASSLRVDTRETLLISGPKPGVWEAWILGARHYRNVTVQTTPRYSSPIQAGATLTLEPGAVGSHSFYRIGPSDDIYRLGFETYSGTGNVNLYVSRGAPPVCHTDPLVKAPCVSEFRSAGGTTRETVTVDLPDTADYYATVVGFSAYSDVVLAATLLEGRTLSAQPAAMTFTAQIGRPLPPVQVITLGGPDIMFAWTLNVLGNGPRNWLRTTRASGTGKGTVNISVDIGGLTAGTYSGTVTIAAPRLKGSPVQLPVTLRVAPQ